MAWDTELEKMPAPGSLPRCFDIGAVDNCGDLFHSPDASAFRRFVEGARWVVGHNIIAFDIPNCPGLVPQDALVIDTLLLSALIFPQRRFHAIDKAELDAGNPCEHARASLERLDEIVLGFAKLSPDVAAVLRTLLEDEPGIEGFFDYLTRTGNALCDRIDGSRLPDVLRSAFADCICAHAPIETLIAECPATLAYVLAFLHAHGADAAPVWVLRSHPRFDELLTVLAGTPCQESCPFCREHFGATEGLKRFFGYESFRTYDGEPLQEHAVKAALRGQSLLALFPTGGGKSLTFQLPALMQAAATGGLTLVISPLLSLMKDQVDQFEQKGIVGGFTINGLLTPIERADALQAVADGRAEILYVSPEVLRSMSVLTALSQRRIERVVIDEAHCLSAWGHDFRVDYLHIGDFLAEMRAKTGRNIPVSCFTATAKPKVLQDILDFFRIKTGLELQLFRAGVARRNLAFRVEHVENDQERYARLRMLLMNSSGPAIVYANYASTTVELADKLCADGIVAVAYNGKLDPLDRISRQEDFINDRVRIMVATNAFGMGVDKSDVTLVVHYEISASLENYVQEAGRAGRSESISAECVILFNEEDLDNIFQLQNRSQLSLADMQRLWRAIKNETKRGPKLCISPLELARSAGWPNLDGNDVETRVLTGISLLEETGYVRRGRNAPCIFATSIAARTAIEGRKRLEAFQPQDTPVRALALRVLSSVIGARSISEARGEIPAKRIDVLAENLSASRREILDAVDLLKSAGVLADDADTTAGLPDSLVKATNTLRKNLKLENALLERLPREVSLSRFVNLKAVNGSITGEKNAFGMRELVTALIQLKATKTLDARQADASRHVWVIAPKTDWEAVESAYEKRAHLAEVILQQLFALVKPQERIVEFSTHAIVRSITESTLFPEQVSLKDVEATLLYLHRIQVIRLISGFAVLYLPITIERLVLENKRQFRREDYGKLAEHYQQKVQQVHIVGEYANLMIKNAEEALRYVSDYFQLDVRAFTKRWFAGRTDELSRHMTKTRANRVLNSLSDAQRAVLESKAQHIVVAAGPGSGKTRVLVHKLAHLLLEEDVKPEELLVLTFSRAAANEFKRRLIKLYGPAALAVEIRTFHAYAFDVLGRLGTLDDADGVVVRATEAIEAGEVEPERLAKGVLVLDEAQDMSQAEFSLICALMRANDAMRVIAVGDDDQNIYAFRGSSSVFMMRLLSEFEAERHELLENYRSDSAIVNSAESFIAHLPGRLKTDPCRSVTKQTGRVRLRRVVGTGPLERAAVRSAHEALSELSKQPSGGSVAILVPTNEAAGVIVGILWEEGVAATLIQSTSQCRFSDLLEVQWLLRALERRLDGEATVSFELWTTLREDFDRRFAQSRWRSNVDRLLDSLESVTDPSERFASDVVEFLTESRLEDTFPPQARRVTVSTYHKAKGLEFDRVILAAPSTPSSPEDVRAMYVAITRARHELVIVTRDERMRLAFAPQAPIEIEEDAACYPPVGRILLSTGLRDVNLGRFKGYKERICRRLLSGMPLVVRRYGFEAAGVGRFTYSASFLRDQLEPLLSRGYVVTQAHVNFIVRWHNQDDGADEAIVLPMLTLERRSDAREAEDVK